LDALFVGHGKPCLIGKSRSIRAESAQLDLQAAPSSASAGAKLWEKVSKTTALQSLT
jgi:hypothetical protein